MGLLWLGTIPLTSGLIVVFFGPRYLSMLYGLVFLSHQVGSFVGAWLGGIWYDWFGNYEAMWWLNAAAGLFPLSSIGPFANQDPQRRRLKNTFIYFC